MIPFIVGALAMLGLLFLLGITRGRFVKQKPWVVIWFSLSVILAGFILISHFFLTTRYSHLAAGFAVGYVIGIAVHTFDHFREELRKNRSSK